MVSFLRWMQNVELRFTTSAEGVGEQEKTIKYRFFDAKELKQGVCRAEQAQATADDYATRVGLSNPTSASKKKSRASGFFFLYSSLFFLRRGIFLDVIGNSEKVF